MSRRLKSRGMVLMVFPVVFTGNVAFWRSRVPTISTTGPLKIVVGEAHLIEATPLDVGTGYNARIEIPLQLLGTAPNSFRLSS